MLVSGREARLRTCADLVAQDTIKITNLTAEIELEDFNINLGLVEECTLKISMSCNCWLNCTFALK